jgi:hypothetical protein
MIDLRFILHLFFSYMNLPFRNYVPDAMISRTARQNQLFVRSVMTSDFGNFRTTSLFNQ